MKRAKRRVNTAEQQQQQQRSGPLGGTQRPSPDRVYKPVCYLTRGSEENEWNVWNASSEAVNLRPGDKCSARILDRNFESCASIVVQALVDLVLLGCSGRACALDRDVRFHTDARGVLQCAARQDELTRLCLSKGVDCSLFLNCYAQKPEDEKGEDSRLGARLQVLFARSVKEMLRRQYDVTHHYPLFRRALSLHYTSEVRSGPPEVEDMVAPGGLLDRSAEEHVTLHGVPLVGSDRFSFSRWRYYEEDEDPAEDHRKGEARDGSVDETEGDKLDVEEPGSAEAEGETPISGGNGSSREEEVGGNDGEDLASGEDEDVAAVDPGIAHGVGEIYAAFNNLSGTLTDGPKGFPYAFTVFTGAELRFNDLVDYCLKRASGPLGPLPARCHWGSINPVLLMEDPVDRDTGKVSRRYTVTSRGHLSTLIARSSSSSPCDRPPPCYNEVFLPGRPVSRLNLDLDLKCCRGCSEKFSNRTDRATKARLCQNVVSSLVLVAAESVLGLAGVKRAEVEGNPELSGELCRSLGKFAAYQRVSTAKAKLSMRILWYLPVELCSFDGIEVYGRLLREMERRSLRYSVLSYPDDQSQCGLCDLRRAVGERRVSGSGWLRTEDPNAGSRRRSAIDKAPYSCRKCVRLPNCSKDGFAFEYVDTFNAREDLEDPRFEDPCALSVGLSSNPIAPDVTSLGARFECAVGAERIWPGPEMERPGAPDRAVAESEARRLSDQWGVPVTLRTTGSGLVYVQADEKSETYPCPIHGRVHSRTKLCALVFDSHTKAKCFVA